MTNNKTVLVTGGTGFTGTFLLKKLCASGFQVRAIRRPSSNIDALKDLPIDWYSGDVYDEELLARAMEGVQEIYHVAAAYRVTNLPEQEYYDVHLTSTKILARLALKQPSFDRFVLVSTVGVLGHIENPPVDESAPYNPGDLYQLTKKEAEEWLIEFAAEHRLPYSVVRPAAIYGPGDRRLLKLFKIAKLPVMPIIGRSKGLYHLIHVEDLVDFICLVPTLSETEGEIFICGDPEPSSIQEMLSIISSHLDKKPRFFRIPATPVFALARLVDRISRMVGVEPIIYPRRIAFFTKDRAFNTTKMQALTHFKYSYDTHSGLQELADWYIEQGWL